MVKSADRRVALISVHPEFADKLLSGEKQVELRRTKLRGAISHLAIYATAPRSAVLGWVTVTNVESASPTSLWNAHKQHAGISRARFRRYFQGCKLATAIRVAEPRHLETPFRLSQFRENVSPPQSWRYLSDDDATKLGIEV